MVNKTTLVVAGVACFVILLYFWVSTQSYTDTSDGYFSSATYVDATHFIPKDWNGLPLSHDNNLFVNKSKETEFYQKQLVGSILKLPQEEWDNDDWYWLLDYYVPLIGWNGFMDALDASVHFGLKPNAQLWHHLGELLGEAAAEPEYAIELTARNSLHKSPLHGSVWYWITQFDQFKDPNELFTFVDQRLCYFRERTEIYNIWISCAHGVGHGLAKLYLHDIPAGLEVCALHPDNDFAYSCATGVFMDSQDQLPKHEATPCDSVKLSAACFRYKGQYFRDNGRDGQSCANMPPLNQRGCIFGEAHELVEDCADSILFCSKYLPQTQPDVNQPDWRNYMACLEGSWQSNRVYELEDPQAYCHQFPQDFLQNICLAHSIPVGEGDDEKWNYNILEVL